MIFNRRGNIITENRRNWGKRKERKRDFKRIKTYFDNLKKDEECLLVDDLTWQDLNMDDLYSEMDRTHTTAGEEVLYDILRKPLKNEEDLKKRNEIIEAFEKNEELREEVGYILHKVDKIKHSFKAILFDNIEQNKMLKFVCRLLGLIPLISILAIPFIGLSALWIVFIVSSINMAIHYKTNKEIQSQIILTKYMGKILGAANSISKLQFKELEGYSKRLFELSKKCAKLRKNSLGIGRVEGIDIIGDYINVLFLSQENMYFNVVEELIKNKEELKEVHRLIGELDVFLSIASYKSSLKNYCNPKFTQEKRVLNIENALHPLLIDGVPNSISAKSEGIILTGSNMSGKSTFLRTIALNAILAQSLYFVVGDRYESSFFNVVTSISLGDSILSGKSYFLVEVEAILRIINSLNEDITCLCFIDEIFRGTNPVERISAAAEIANYIVERNSISMIATHDLQLTTMIKDSSCYYFTEYVDEEGLKFDYKLREGVCPSRNALKLLEFVGYPKEITEKAKERIS